MRINLVVKVSALMSVAALLALLYVPEVKADTTAPGKDHEVLAKLEGNWEYILKWWDEPGSEAEIATGTSDKKLIMDGRYLAMEHNGTLNGMDFEGFGIKSYDNVKEEYGTVWIDNLGTGLSVTNGFYDPVTKKLTESGTTTMSGTEAQYRGVTTFVDDDTYTYEYFVTGPDDQEFRQMVVMYKKTA